MADPVDKVPPWVTVTVTPSAIVTSPTVVVAKVAVEFAVNCTFDPEAQADPPVGRAVAPQLEPVTQVLLVPSVRQNCCAWTDGIATNAARAQASGKERKTEEKVGRVGSI